MKRSISIIILFLFVLNGNIAQNIVPIEKEFPLNWKADIGNVTYRTNVISANNYLLIGSNGNNYRDYAIDQSNGLKVIDPKTGKINKVILGESYGDVDVNGVIVHDNKIYFGNDNDEFVCVDIQGKILWRLPISGDVEHEPIVVKVNNKSLIVFATETGELRAVDHENGNTVWEYLHPDFKGWRQGDNRFVFKIKTHFRSGGVFFSKPAVADLNSDGVLDLIYSCNYAEIRAFNGANGKLMWKIKSEEKDEWKLNTSYHYSPVIAGKGSNLQMLINKHKYENENWINKFSIYDRKGRFIRDYHYRPSAGYYGLNSLNIDAEKVLVPFTRSIAIFDVNNKRINFIEGLNLKYTYTDWQNNQRESDRFSYDPLLGNQLIQFKNEECAVLLHQHDYPLDGQPAVVSIVGLKSNSIHKRFHLPSGSEFAPYISDVNKDGKLDLLVGCYDGKLYCYNMGISTKNLLIEEKKYSIYKSDNKKQSNKTVEYLTEKENEENLEIQNEINDQKEDINAIALKNVNEKDDQLDEGLSSANLYLLSYGSFALLIFAGASFYLFRKKEGDSYVDQA